MRYSEEEIDVHTIGAVDYRLKSEARNVDILTCCNIYFVINEVKSMNYFIYFYIRLYIFLCCEIYKSGLRQHMLLISTCRMFNRSY